MQKYYDGEKTRLEMLMDLYVSRTSPKQQDVVSGEPSVCMGGLM
jgi:hypothetical protein